jgi:hypothetical protein
VRRKAGDLPCAERDEWLSDTLGKAGVLRVRGARFEDDTDETVSIELVPSPVGGHVAIPPSGTVGGTIVAGDKSPFFVVTVDCREPRLKRPLAFGADATRLIRRDAVAPMERVVRGRCPEEWGGGSGKKLLVLVGAAVAGGPPRSRVIENSFPDFDLELGLVSKDASGEGETSRDGAAWSGGVAGIFSLLESEELLEELDESR